ncbi:MAG: hypothetical protein KIT25_04410 [Enhydrobacter sp.]|nr:MAG: hypothetical protein KIT25_04410 [Enhydrobacter sp.]
MPELRNSDGDGIAFTTVRYPLKKGCDRAALERALTAIPGFDRADDGVWNWHVPAAQGTAAAVPAGVQTFSSTFADGSVSMGHVELMADTLELEANSPQRAQKGRALLEPIVEAFVGEPAVETRTVTEMMASRPADEKPAALPSSGLPPAEERALVQSAIDRHYRGLLDQPVPMLGNVSLRRAARTKKGREKLVEWLKLLENGNARQAADSPMAGYDIGWMWDDLGIGDLRR